MGSNHDIAPVLSYIYMLVLLLKHFCNKQSIYTYGSLYILLTQRTCPVLKPCNTKLSILNTLLYESLYIQSTITNNTQKEMYRWSHLENDCDVTQHTQGYKLQHASFMRQSQDFFFNALENTEIMHALTSTFLWDYMLTSRSFSR